MIKKDFIKYWIDTSEKDWEVSQVLFKQKKYLYSLFFAHLHIEKICKALWVKIIKAIIRPKFTIF
jgi:HEPN domain-containing protein